MPAPICETICSLLCGSTPSVPVPVAAPVSPLAVIPADDVIAGWDAAVNVQAGGSVSVLPDVSGNGFNLIQAVGVNQPTFNAAGGPNGTPSVLFDGVDDFMVNAALDLPAPGTTPTTYWAVIRQVTWNGGAFERFWEAGIAGTSGLTILQIDDTPEIAQFNGATVGFNAGLEVNVYSVLEALFADAPIDRVDVGGVLATGVSAGNNDPAAGFTLAADAALAGAWSNIELCELWLFRVALTSTQRAQLRAYATAKYGAIP